MQDPAVLESAESALLTPPTASAEPEIAAKQLTQSQLAWIRFRKHKPAMIGMIVVAIMIILAFLAPVLTPYSPYNPPSLTDFTSVDLTPRLNPGWWYLMGTDAGGHPILSQILWGARVSLSVGFISAFASTIIGVLVGAVAGYFGGWVDTTMMRVTDIFLTLPFLPLLILAAAVFGQGHVALIILIFVIFYWPFVARLCRASYLSLREQEFTEAARAVGVGNTRIIFRHLLPNALRPIIVQTTLSIAVFIILEAAIDYLGAGLKFPDTSWGNILSDAQSDLINNGNWWWVTFPGLFLTLTVLSVNFLGDGLGDALDVRSRT